jgi:hypothetical protein
MAEPIVSELTHRTKFAILNKNPCIRVVSIYRRRPNPSPRLAVIKAKNRCLHQKDLKDAGNNC